MKRPFTTKKKAIAASIAALAVVGGSIGAYAYWTTTGSGSGSGTVGTNQAVTISATSTPSLVPNGTATVSFTVTNPAAFPQQVSTIHLNGVTAYDTAANATAGGATGLIGTCGGSNTGSATTTSGPDFWMVDVTVPLADGHIAASATNQALTTTGTLRMNDLLSQNQDSCKSAFLRLSLSST